MSYDMTTMHTNDWRSVFKSCRKNRLKLILKPHFNKKELVILDYQNHLGKKPNLDSPKTFTEKLNTIKLNKKIQKKLSNYVDKHKVRKYVSAKIGTKYLIPEYLYTKKLKTKDLRKIPNSFVIKTTNGSGTNYIVKNKKKTSLKEIVSYINWLSKLKYGYMWGEFFYNNIKPGIIIEKLLLDKKNNIPDDLKCFCFKDNKGEKHKILYLERVIGDKRSRIMFDENWNPINYSSHNFDKLNIKLKKPDNSDEILSVIDKLSEDFSFVRVDLFLLDKKIYFGELTFVPTAGYMKFDDPKIDYLWGSWIGDQIISKENYEISNNWR